MTQTSAMQRLEQTQGTAYDIMTGPLAKTYGLFVPNTINTGAEISAARIGGAGLQKQWFYTANVPLATKRKGKLLLGIGGRKAFNEVFGQDIEAVCQELINTGYVQLGQRKKDIILGLERSGEVVFVDPDSLALKGKEDQYRCFSIRTGSYEKDVTVPRMPFVGAGYGSGDMLERVMSNLNGNNISETKIYTMNPEHAAENVNDNGIVARASGLYVFGIDSGFVANDGFVGGHFGLRGVLKDAAKGGTPEVSSLDDLAGRGIDAGRGVALVHQRDISPEMWQLLIRRQ